MALSSNLYGHSVTKDSETGDFYISGGIDEELTDADAEGDTDSEAFRSEGDTSSDSDASREDSGADEEASETNSLKEYWARREEEDMYIDSGIPYNEPANDLVTIHLMPYVYLWDESDCRPLGIETEAER